MYFIILHTYIYKFNILHLSNRSFLKLIFFEIRKYMKSLKLGSVKQAYNSILAHNEKKKNEKKKVKKQMLNSTKPQII